MPPKDKARVRFAGYAAVFNALDRGGDVIRPGAFAQSLKTINAIPLLWQHKGGQVVGRIDKVSEDMGSSRLRCGLLPSSRRRILSAWRRYGGSEGG